MSVSERKSKTIQIDRHKGKLFFVNEEEKKRNRNGERERFHIDGSGTNK